MAIALAFGCAATSAGQAPERTGTVQRGMMTGGIWLELANNEQGQVELAVLDGLPGGAPQTRFVALAQEGEGTACALVNAQAGVRVTPCQPYGGAASVTLGGATGDVVFQDVGWQGSFAWGGAAASVADARARCLMPGISRIESLSGTQLGTAIASMKSAVSQLPESSSDLAAAITDLRAERLAAYAALALTPAEQRASQELEAAILGRTTDGRAVSLSQAATMRQDFERTVGQTPQRKQARQKLLTIDRQLAEIYDPIDGMRQTMLRAQIRDQLVPAVQEGLIQLLADRQPGSIVDLLSLESAAADIDSCAAAVNLRGTLKARELVQSALGFRVDEVAGLLTSVVNAAPDSTSARQALAVFETNPAIMRVLSNGGKTGAITTAKSRIAKLAADEERARLAGVRAAAAAAAADAVAPTTSGGRFSSTRVDRSIVYVGNRRRQTRGSGFIVAPGIVVTNVHVVGDSPTVYLTPDGKDPYKAGASYEGTVIARYPTHDIAIVRVPNLPGRIVAIAGKEPNRGSEVWAVGYPGAADRAGAAEEEVVASFTRGVVSRIVDGYTTTSQGPEKTRLIQTDAQFSKGNSGGPLFDTCHRVVGINSQGSLEAPIQFSVGTVVLAELLRKEGIKPTVSTAGCN
ncbi:MAG: trypsin-like peptidase domain-containing protein [Porphyrobacter sp.]|nr:trypsin-like peptidase domain-containing protein [Porphyrobacter sp.]